MTFAATPTLPAWADIDRETIAPLAAADPYGAAQYLVQLEPKCSAKDLASELERLGGPRLTKREAAGWREQALGEKPVTRAPKDPDEPQDVFTARNRMAAAVTIGDANGALRWSRVVQIQRDAGVSDVTPVVQDFGSLTDVQMSAYRVLIDLAEGKPVTDPEGVWWLTLFGRVPTQRAEIHPAHVALPAGSPIPPRLTAAK